MKTENIITMTAEEARKRYLSPESLAQLRRLAARPDSEIEYSDNPEIKAEDIASGKLRIVNRGGARTGAGRKPKGFEHASLRMPAELKHAFQSLAKKQHKTFSAVVLEHLRQPKKVST